MIYCVEDERNIRELLIYTLETTGFKAKGFGNGAELMKALKEETPELILLDIMLLFQAVKNRVSYILMHTFIGKCVVVIGCCFLCGKCITQNFFVCIYLTCHVSALLSLTVHTGN